MRIRKSTLSVGLRTIWPDSAKTTGVDSGLRSTAKMAAFGVRVCSEKGWTVFRRVGETHRFPLSRWVSPTLQLSDQRSGTDSDYSDRGPSRTTKPGFVRRVLCGCTPRLGSIRRVRMGRAFRGWVRSLRFDAQTSCSWVRSSRFATDASACWSVYSEDFIQSLQSWVRSSRFLTRRSWVRSSDFTWAGRRAWVRSSDFVFVVLGPPIPTAPLFRLTCAPRTPPGRPVILNYRNSRRPAPFRFREFRQCHIVAGTG
jgi:hypothetical protein